jgi:hypothetical protein
VQLSAALSRKLSVTLWRVHCSNVCELALPPSVIIFFICDEIKMYVDQEVVGCGCGKLGSGCVWSLKIIDFFRLSSRML